MQFRLDTREFDKKYAELVKVLQDGKEFLGGELKPFEMGKIQRNFGALGQTLGDKWAPLKPSTLAQKRALGYPADPLIRTGKMKKNFTQKSLTKTALEIQNTTPYFKFHQLGTSKMVKRQVLGFKPDFIRQIKELYEKYLSKHFK